LKYHLIPTNATITAGEAFRNTVECGYRQNHRMTKYRQTRRLTITVLAGDWRANRQLVSDRPIAPRQDIPVNPSQN